MRLIDADAPRKKLVDWINWYAGSEAVKSVGRDAVEILDAAPTIEAEPVRHGRWEWIINWGCAAYLEPIEPLDAGWGCSVCGIDLIRYLQSHFPDIPSYLDCACEEMPTLERCPNCGAEMNAKDIDVPTTQMDGGADG